MTRLRDIRKILKERYYFLFAIIKSFLLIIIYNTGEIYEFNSRTTWWLDEVDL